MRYDNIKIGPCWTVNVKVELDQMKHNVAARSSFISNKPVLALLVAELDVANPGKKHRVIGVQHNHVYEVKGLLPSTNINIDTGIEGDPVRVRTLGSIGRYITVETAGHYTFTGVEVKSMEPDTGTLIVAFETVEVESTGTAVFVPPCV